MRVRKCADRENAPPTPAAPWLQPPGLRCAEWQREPLRVTFHPAGKDAVSYDIVPGSAVLVEDTGDEEETPAAAPAK